MNGHSGVLRRLASRRALDHTRSDDSGMALVLVVGSMLIIMMLALTALAYAVESQGFARRTQDHTGAMAAAQSGIDDFVGRLNRDDVYDLTLDCANEALRGPLAATSPYPAGTCGYTAATSPGWLPVIAGETDPEAASFHYQVIGRDDSQQSLTLHVTGRVAGEYRTIEAVVAKGGSTDYVYYTDFESADPSNVQAYTPAEIAAMSAADKDACGINGNDAALYFYEDRGSHPCSEITFIAGDVLDGPVFSNDAVLSNGGHFLDGFSSVNPGCLTVTPTVSTWNSCLRSGSMADFDGNQPKDATPLNLGDTSAEFANSPGCHYFGSTRIVFNGNGTMTVWNKTSVNGGTAPLALTTAGQPVPNCGSLFDLNTGGATVAVPNNMVVYVAAAPMSVTRRQCSAGELGGPGALILPIGTYNAAAAPTPAFGVTYTYTADTNMAETTKYCAEGNLYAEGTVSGRVTLAAAQSIIATGDLVLTTGHNGSDLLGLVATNSVEVFHPRKATFSSVKRYANCATSGPGGAPQYYQYCPGTAAAVAGWPKRYIDPTTGAKNPTTGIQIAASIQTLQHSFLVQKYADGSYQGTLQVWGSIAQRWRGIVGTSSGGAPVSGYTKLYQYDQNLRVSAPPYFPRWVNAQWLLRYSGEIDTPAAVKAP